MKAFAFSDPASELTLVRSKSQAGPDSGEWGSMPHRGGVARFWTSTWARRDHCDHLRRMQWNTEMISGSAQGVKVYVKMMW